MILGIDFGSSATDYVVMEKDILLDSGSFFDSKINWWNIIAKYGVKQINYTGGRAFKIIGIKSKKVDEIKAIGNGGRFISGLRAALVVSIGSGTAMVSVKNKRVRHIGGTPVGARTLQGLANTILGTDDIRRIERMTMKGDLDKVDLTLKSIYPQGIGILDKNATAAHFGNMKKASKNDMALGLVNLCAQTIGTLAGFGAKANGHRSVVLTGKICQMKQFQEIILKRISTVLKVKVIVPEKAGVATAIGAAVS